jgi:hypothetical protein
LKKHKIIEITSDSNTYYCRVDSFDRIIFVDPYNEFLNGKNLFELFNKYRDRVKFTMFDDDVDPDCIVAEDIYKKMLIKNPCLEFLTKKFNLEITS